MCFMKNIIIPIALLLLFFSCYGQEHKDNHHDANEYMNRTSSERLIDIFSSPERDEWQKPDLVIEQMGDLQDKTVMDLGSGSGYFTFKLAKVAQKVIAADVNEEFLQHIKEEKQKHESIARKIEVRKVPYDSPSLAENEVHIVLLANAYHHLKDRVAYFQKVKKGLKDNGKVMIIDYRKDSKHGPPKNHKLAADVALAELEQVGFSSIDYVPDLLPRQYIITAFK